MIYVISGHKHILVLEPSNLQHLREGDVVHSPDDQVMLVYTPDILWFKDQMKDMLKRGKIDAAEFDKIHKLSMSREEVLSRPYHETELQIRQQDGQNRKMDS